MAISLLSTSIVASVPPIGGIIELVDDPLKLSIRTVDGATYLRSGRLLYNEEANYPEAYSKIGKNSLSEWGYKASGIATDSTFMVAKGNGVKVIVSGSIWAGGNPGNMYWSSDDVNWWPLSNPYGYAIHSIIFAHGRFHIVTTGGYYYYSDTGKSVAVSSIAVPVSGPSIVASSTPNYLFYISNDYTYRSINNGASWISTYHSYAASGIHFVNNIVFVLQASGYLRYSINDGATWVSKQVTINGSNSTLQSITYIDGYYYVCSSSGVARSIDLITWTTVSTVGSINLVKCGSKLFFTSPSAANGIYTSTDGAVWTVVSHIKLPNTPLGQVEVYESVIVIRLSSSFATLLISTDYGTTWTIKSLGTINQSFVGGEISFDDGIVNFPSTGGCTVFSTTGTIGIFGEIRREGLVTYLRIA